MSQDYVDIALVQVERANSPLVDIEDIVDININTTVNRQLVKTMNRKRVGRGYRRGTKEVSGDITVEKAVAPEFPWREVFKNDEVLQVYYEEAEDGRRFHLRDFIITEIGNETGEDGTSQLKISWMALDEVELPV